jgi:hypothetical protein
MSATTEYADYHTIYNTLITSLSNTSSTYTPLKKDVISNFLSPLPNTEILEKEVDDLKINTDIVKNALEIEKFYKMKDYLQEKVDEFNGLINERNSIRDEILKNCDKLKQNLNYFVNSPVLLTTDSNDIQFNKTFINTITEIKLKISEYERYVISKIDTDICRLNSTLTKYTTKLNDVIRITSKINKDVMTEHFKNKMPTSKISCTVCLTNNSSHALVPCGHIFCGSCVEKFNNSCAVCRNTITSSLKLYNLCALDEV